MAKSMDGLLLFCHGARAPTWREPFDQVCADITKQLSLDERFVSKDGAPRIELAFLEFMEPDFAKAVDKLYDSGARTIGVSLLFLATGGHTMNDVSALVQSAKEKHPDLHLDVSDTLLSNASIRGAIVNELVASYLPT